MKALYLLLFNARLFFSFSRLGQTQSVLSKKRDLERIHWHLDCAIFTVSFTEHNLFIVKAE